MKKNVQKRKQKQKKKKPREESYSFFLKKTKFSISSVVKK